jgi:hypothetical protein
MFRVSFQRTCEPVLAQAEACDSPYYSRQRGYQVRGQSEGREV